MIGTVFAYQMFSIRSPDVPQHTSLTETNNDGTRKATESSTEKLARCRGYILQLSSGESWDSFLDLSVPRVFNINVGNFAVF